MKYCGETLTSCLDLKTQTVSHVHGLHLLSRRQTNMDKLDAIFVAVGEVAI